MNSNPPGTPPDFDLPDDFNDDLPDLPDDDNPPNFNDNIDDDLPPDFNNIPSNDDFDDPPNDDDNNMLPPDIDDDDPLPPPDNDDFSEPPSSPNIKLRKGTNITPPDSPSEFGPPPDDMSIGGPPPDDDNFDDDDDLPPPMNDDASLPSLPPPSTPKTQKSAKGLQRQPSTDSLGPPPPSVDENDSLGDLPPPPGNFYLSSCEVPVDLVSDAVSVSVSSNPSKVISLIICLNLVGALALFPFLTNLGLVSIAVDLSVLSSATFSESASLNDLSIPSRDNLNSPKPKS